jgi:hypothetical protein
MGGGGGRTTTPSFRGVRAGGSVVVVVVLVGGGGGATEAGVSIFCIEIRNMEICFCCLGWRERMVVVVVVEDDHPGRTGVIFNVECDQTPSSYDFLELLGVYVRTSDIGRTLSQRSL